MFYTIDFTVTAAGVSPDTPQFAGHTGDHRAALLKFAVPFEGYRYRLEIVDGCGGYDITALLDAVDGAISYEIPSAWTAAGVAAVRLVAVEQDEAGEEIVRFHSAPAYVCFADREDGEPLGESLRPAWQETLDEAQFLLKTVGHKLENGELNGKDGEKGDKGDTGEDGYTPQKGVDYYTDAEREALIAELGARDVDQAFDRYSSKAIANAVVTNKVIDLDRIVNSAPNTFANALKGTAIGSVIAVNDVSPAPHDVGVKVSSKNLLNNNTDKLEPWIQSDTITRYGYYISLPAGTYTVHAEPLVDSFDEYIYHQAEDENGNVIADIGSGFRHPVVGTETTARTFRVDRDFMYHIYAAGVNALAAAKNVFEKFNIQLEHGDTATPYQPHIEDLMGVKVTRYGKNLIPFPYPTSSTTINGVTFTINEDASILVNGTATKTAVFYIAEASLGKTLAGKTCVLSGGAKGGSATTHLMRMQFFDATNANVSELTDLGDNGSGACQTISEAAIKSSLFIAVFKGATADNLVFKPQIELGTIATEYEPYIEPSTHSAEADGTSVWGVRSLAPNMTLLTDIPGVNIEVEYNQDTNAAMGNVKSDLQELDRVTAELAAQMGGGEHESVKFVDRITGWKYTLFVSNGKLMMEKVEE